MRRLLPVVVVAALAVAGCGRRPGSPEAESERQRLRAAQAAKAQETEARQIEDAVFRFRDDVGRLPTNLAEVVQLGYVQRIPQPPEGMVYFFDPVFGNVKLVPRGTPGTMLIEDEDARYRRSLMSNPTDLPSPGN